MKHYQFSNGVVIEASCKEEAIKMYKAKADVRYKGPTAKQVEKEVAKLLKQNGFKVTQRLSIGEVRLEKNGKELAYRINEDSSGDTSITVIDRENWREPDGRETFDCFGGLYIVAKAIDWLNKKCGSEVTASADIYYNLGRLKGEVGFFLNAADALFKLLDNLKRNGLADSKVREEMNETKARYYITVTNKKKENKEYIIEFSSGLFAESRVYSIENDSVRPLKRDLNKDIIEFVRTGV